MNDNIKLPPQEWLGYDPERGDIHGYTFEQMREFAELIVKECMRMCEVAQVGYLTHGLEKEASGAISVKQYIEDYLGVEDQYEPEYCPICGEEWSGTSCGAHCGWVTGVEE